MMMKVLAFGIATAAIGVAPAFANVDPKIHKLCVEAKDYLGCVKAMNGVSAHDTNRADAEKCWGEVNDKQIPLSSS